MVPKKEAPKKTAKNGEDILRSVKGMHDILPGEAAYWERVRGVAHKLADFYNFEPIETPVLEHASLFSRTVGEDTDIVQKEMYTLKTKGDDLLALRPEGTAPIVRAYMEHALSRISPIQKLIYDEPMFRHENPQAGRLRQFHQIGLEIIGGPNDPLYDTQVILIFERILNELKIKGLSLKINSIGCRVCRPLYKKQLQGYYKKHLKNLCEDCERRYQTNPLRLLDCKKEQCQPFKADAPTFFDKLCAVCSAHLKSVLEYLDELKISYMLDSQLVRGLDYYSKTVFEFYVENEKGKDMGALVAGGRYDYLMETLGGRQTPAVGGAMGLERVIQVMREQEIVPPEKFTKKVFIMHVGELAKKKSLSVIEDLRKGGIMVIEALTKESLNAQLRLANKEGTALALILGQKEIFEDSIIIRDLKSSLQETVPLPRMLEEVKKRLK